MGEEPAFLLLHGWQHHRPPGHWLVWLADELAARGRVVSYPQLPEPDDPDIGQWFEVVRNELGSPPSGGLVVVCHSLGCLLWLSHAAADPSPPPVDRVLLVAPPDRSLLDRAPELAPFFRPGPGAREVAATSRAPVRLVCSDDDPYCPGGAAGTYGEPLGLDVDLVRGRQHLDPDAGLGPWPDMLGWCLDPTTRFAPG